MPRRLIVAAAFGAIALTLAGCLEFGKKKEDENKAAAPEPQLVRTTSPARRPMNKILEVSGEVEALERTEVTSKLAGLAVIAAHADMGDAVEKDALLAVLDSTEARRDADDARVQELEAGVRVRDAQVSRLELGAQHKGQELAVQQARRSLDRARAQAERGALAAEALEAAEYKLASEQSLLERVKLQIEKADVAAELAKKAEEKAVLARKKTEQALAWTEIRAPFKGVVAKRTARIGQMTGAGQPLFEIFDPATLVVNAQITQRFLPHVTPGQAVEIRSDAHPNEIFAGSVAVISPVVDRTSGAVPIRIQVRDYARLKPGLFISGRIVIETRAAALTVPKKAVLYEREKPLVYRVDTAPNGGRKAMRVYFREGLSDRGEVEVLFEGGDPALKDGDTIVLVGQDRLRDGDAVVIETATDSRAAESRSTESQPLPLNGGG